MENNSSIVPSQIKDKPIFEFFPEIDEEWFKIKSEPAFTLRSPVFVIWEQRPYLFRFGSNRPVTSSSDFMYQNITVFPLASLSGSVDQICVVIYDVTDEAISRNGMNELNRQLQQVSRVDGLTGLYNRRFWDEQFALEYKRGKRSDSPSSLIMLDIDLFKKVNDTYGHPAGDEVIRSLANIIKKATRETDFSARYGGEEFVVLLTETPEKNVHFVAERIRALVEKSVVEYDGLTIKYTVSLGVAGFRATYKDSLAWLNSADKALYKAKELGRNKVIVT
jgi:diguanylate cyclase